MVGGRALLNPVDAKAHARSAALPLHDLPRIIQLMTAPVSQLCQALCQAWLVHDHLMNPHPPPRQVLLLSPNDR